MRQLLGEHNVGALLRELFFQHLPQRVPLVLGASDNATLDHLAEFADKIHEAASPLVSSLANMPESSGVTQIEARNDDLTAAATPRV